MINNYNKKPLVMDTVVKTNDEENYKKYRFNTGSSYGMIVLEIYGNVWNLEFYLFRRFYN